MTTAEATLIAKKIDRIEVLVNDLFKERTTLYNDISDLRKERESLLKTIHEQQVEISGLRDLVNRL